MQMMPVVDIMERHRGGGEGTKIFWAGLAKRLSYRDCVNEDRGTALYTVPQAMENLVSRWMLEVPKHAISFISSLLRIAHNKSMCNPKSRFVYAMFLLFFTFITSQSSP